MSHPALHTRACTLFGVACPIVQTGMGWVAGPRLVAATSRAGGLGILASATMRLPELERAIAEVRSRTDRPFGVNLRADQDDAKARVELLIRERVKLASFAGPPARALVDRLKAGGVLVMPTVGAPRHAEKMAALGVDALIAQGHEGGGHTGSVPSVLLVPEVARLVDLPVLAAGGFKDGRGLAAALAFGAAGVAMGTRFLLTAESTVPDLVKRRYLDTKLDGTVVTRAIDGRPQRVIRTALVEQLERAHGPARLLRALGSALGFARQTRASPLALARAGLALHDAEDLSWAEVLMAANAPMMTKAALVEGRLDAGVLPTGQVVGAIDALPTVEALIAEIMAEASHALDRLAAPAPSARVEGRC